MRLLLAVLALAGCATDTTAIEARRLVARGAVLVDVRTPAEFAEAHPRGAVNIPVETLKARLAELPRGKPIVVYCHSGARAGAATMVLREAGFDVHNVGSLGRFRYGSNEAPPLF
jgi:rhodanese-related sulfurtransferase